MSLGIQNLKEVVDLGLAGGQAVSNALLDGKIGLEDLAFALPALQLAGPAIQGIDQVPAEFADLSEQEAADLVAHVAAKLPGIADERAREIIAASLQTVVSLGRLVTVLRKKDEVVTVEV